MVRRYGIREGVLSLLVPAIVYGMMAFVILYSMWPYFYHIKNEAIVVIGIFATWRYGWQILNYIRSVIYSFYYYPLLRRKVASRPAETVYPDHIYIIVASYLESPWVSIEAFQALLSNLADLPCNATIVASTGSDQDDAVIASVYKAHPVSAKVELVLQRQKDGKRIALGHALRAVARRYDDEENSITIMMDGDSYLERKALEKTIPFFSTFQDLGALTTNEVAYINTRSRWYKDWFNLKFGQRHILFQSHALSNKVLTLTGRFSIFRTSIVVREDFIRQIENDILDHWCHGRFRFLMGDDKSSWYYLLKHGWNMLYIPDVICYSLESRDAKFSTVSLSLPFRWFGNTMRNNARALKVGRKKIGTFIWFAILDQRLSMWTSLVGITGAIILSLTKSYIYLPFYIAWVLLVRIIQMSVIALRGHPVSLMTIPLMLYNQWVLSFIKIRSYYHMSDQKWAKGGKTQEGLAARIRHPLAKLIPTYSMLMSFAALLFSLLLAQGAMSLPDHDLLHSKLRSHVVDAGQHGVIADDRRDDAVALNTLIRQLAGRDRATIRLPAGVINLDHNVHLISNISLQGQADTAIVSRIRQPEAAVINIQGEVGHLAGVLAQTVSATDTQIRLDRVHAIKAGDLLLLKQPNDDAFIQRLGSQVWNREYPYLRQILVRVERVDDKTLRLEKPLGLPLTAKDTRVFLTSPVRNVTLKDLSIRQLIGDKGASPDPHRYENTQPDYAVDAISLNWADNIRLKNIRLINSGRHPLSLDSTYDVSIQQLEVDGAWNKGKGGSGYVKLARTYWSTLSHSRIENIRHIVLQWSSAHNVIRDIRTNVDINLHGGHSYDNVVRDINFAIPQAHPWKAITRTPKNAHWAPPDGDNRVMLHTIKSGKHTKDY